MKILFVAVLAVSLVACASSGSQRGPKDDAFEAAAKSWIGVSTDRMIATWGPPRLNKPYSGPDKPGVTYWHARGLGDGDVPSLHR